MGTARNEISGFGELEIIRLVEQSHLPAGGALQKLGILRSTLPLM